MTCNPRILFAAVALAVGGLTACDPTGRINFGTNHDEGPADDEGPHVTYPNTEPSPDGSIITDPGIPGAPPIIIRPPSNPYPETVSEYDVPWPCGVVPGPTPGSPPLIHPCTHR